MDCLKTLKGITSMLNGEDTNIMQELSDMVGVNVFYQLKGVYEEKILQIGVYSYDALQFVIDNFVSQALPRSGSNCVLYTVQYIENLPQNNRATRLQFSEECSTIHCKQEVRSFKPFMYPDVYPNEFKFCSCDSQGPLSFNLTSQDFIHMLDSLRLKDLLVNTLKSKTKQNLAIEQKQFNFNDRKHYDYCREGLVYFGVKYPESTNAEKMANKYQGSYGYMKERRYGGCQMVVPAKDYFEKNDFKHFFNRGTKKYHKEYSQQIFVSSKTKSLYSIDKDSSMVHNLQGIDVGNFEWKFNFCSNQGHFTNLEVVALGEVRCELSNLKIEFNEKHMRS